VLHDTRFAPLNQQSILLVCGLALTVLVAAVVLIAVQPYALVDWQTFLADTIRESQTAWGTLDVPYTRQYAGTLPYFYSIWQTAFWGLGLPLGLAAWAGFAAALVRWLRRGSWADTLLLAWAGPYLAIIGLFHARYLRYMLPLVPILCILAAQLLTVRRRSFSAMLWRRILGVGYGGLILCTCAYSLVFASLYTAPHSWITASEWIYNQVPAGSTLAVEEWDTALPLPLNLNGQPRRIEEYDVRSLALYDEPDDTAKWSSLAADLSASDYIIIASRRLYGSIPRLADRYPLSSRYYNWLFAGELGFELAGEFSRGTTWLNPPLPPLPDAAPAWLRPDESFVVYDHPRALVFRNVEHLSAAELLGRLNSP
jgi:4-amino-4-deoxy-L-arabinose transferase-like glycosyltransferase